MDERTEARKAFEAAVLDPVSHPARTQVCETVAAALQSLGHSAWVGGWMLRDEWTEGLGIVVQMGGELAAGAVTLLGCGRHYPAAALVRQLVEVEYLAFTFAEDEPLARSWLTASTQQLRDLFQPAPMRRRSGGRFRDAEYWSHCNAGGHPHPRGAHLLPDHANSVADNQWQWVDLAHHLNRLWDCLLVAVRRQQWAALIDDLDASTVRPVLEQWHAVDPLAQGITLPPTALS
jgi:hypothetical protein